MIHKIQGMNNLTGDHVEPDLSRSTFLIGDWRIEAMLNTIVRDDLEHRLEPKVMKVLLILAAHPQQVVTKEAIMQAVWPATFVGDDVLTRCISVLRHSMRDSAQEPRYIQTIPKVGYRLVGKVQILEETTAEPEPAPVPPAQPLPSATPSASSVPSHAAGLRPRQRIRNWHRIWTRWGAWISACALLLAVGFSLLGWRFFHPAHHLIQPTRTLQFTSFAGQQSRPVFSPDGSHIAFVWQSENDSSQHIYIKDVQGQSLFRLTDEDEAEYSPAWSPDGTQIAWLAETRTGFGLYISPARPSSPRQRVYIPEEPTHWEQGDLSWAPDGKSIILADHVGAQPHSSIYRVELGSLRVVPLTTPPAGWEGDMSPAYSPDGSRIAFLRASESSVRDLYWMDARGGEAHRLTQDGRNIDGIAWTADGKSLVFASDRAGKYALWQIALNDHSPERLPVGTEDATEPALSLHGNMLAYTQSSALWSIVSVAASGRAEATQPTVLLSSTQQDSAPAFAPDGEHFAFQSWRSGSQELWIASADGKSLRQLTSFGNSMAGSPAWSPHDDQIAFDARLEGHSHIFTVAAQGGVPHQLTSGDSNEIVPRWSADGRSLYFRSNRGGRWQIWKMPAAGGAALPVTSDDGMIAGESPDGLWLYFTRGYQAGLWRVSTSGGAVAQILPQPAAGYWGYWSITPRGIYYLDSRGPQPSIELFDPASGKSTHFATLSGTPPPNAGLSPQPDGRAVILTDLRNIESHITLALGLQ